MKKIWGILVLGLLWCNISFALSQQSAIDQNLSGRKLATIEGIWINTNTQGVYVIYKSGGDRYNVKIIRHNVFDSGETVAWISGGGSTYYGSQTAYTKGVFGGTKRISGGNGTYTLNSRDYLTNTYNGSRGSFSESYRRIWPNDIISHNAKFEKKSPGKKPDKKYDDKKIVAAASGTGFFVSRSGHIVTNHHVIEGCNAVKVSFKGDEIEAKILAVDKMNDLAIIKAKIKPNKVYSVAGEDVALLEDVIIAGFPLGKKVSSAIKTSKGSVTALAGYGDNYSEFQTDAALNQGNSGGPIMDQKGNVVGIAVANFGKKEGIESFNFGIKSSTLKTFAKANELTFQSPNYRDLSNKDLGKLITEATVYLECWMTVAKIKQMIAKAENRKAFFSEYE